MRRKYTDMFILRKIYYILFDLIQTLVIAGAIFVVIYAFLFRPYQVNGLSMYPNFENGEYVLTNLISKRFGEFKKGDIVVFRSPTEKNKDFIKRIIGTQGDTISINKGNFFLNGSLLEEDYLPSNYITNGGSFLSEGIQIRIPEGQYFVAGDNRSNSSDSREWGFVSKDKMIGKSFFVYWPLPKLRVVEHLKNN